MNREQATLPDPLQALSLGYVDIQHTQSEEKYCHQPMVIYYDYENYTEFDWDCLLPCEDNPRYQNNPDVEIRPRSMTKAICCAQRDMTWCLMCAICCYTPALLTDLTYLAYSCCTFPIKQYAIWKRNRSDNQEYARFFSSNTQTLQRNVGFYSQTVNESSADQPTTAQRME